MFENKISECALSFNSIADLRLINPLAFLVNKPTFNSIADLHPLSLSSPHSRISFQFYSRSSLQNKITIVFQLPETFNSIADLLLFAQIHSKLSILAFNSIADLLETLLEIERFAEKNFQFYSRSSYVNNPLAFYSLVNVFFQFYSRSSQTIYMWHRRRMPSSFNSIADLRISDSHRCRASSMVAFNSIADLRWRLVLCSNIFDPHDFQFYSRSSHHTQDHHPHLSLCNFQFYSRSSEPPRLRSL